MSVLAPAVVRQARLYRSAGKARRILMQRCKELGVARQVCRDAQSIRSMIAEN